MLREISAVSELGSLERHGLQSGVAHIEILPNSLPPDDCDTSGGSPPSAEAPVPAIRSDPDLEATAPVPARVGGIVDLPEGMSMRTLAITVMAPEENFEEVIEEADPIIESIEFHSG
jgi:hypothetical protein